MPIHLETERLKLRPFYNTDAKRVQELAGDREVAKTTLGIPHPYTVENAEQWISNHSQNIEAGTIFPLAIVLTNSEVLLGTMTLRVDKQHNKGELAYWVGKDFWGKGYATEAASLIMKFGFYEIGLNRIWAMAMSSNPASTRVMQKVGMKKEGTLVEHIKKFDKYEDLDVYGVLKNEFTDYLK